MTSPRPPAWCAGYALGSRPRVALVCTYATCARDWHLPAKPEQEPPRQHKNRRSPTRKNLRAGDSQHDEGPPQHEPPLRGAVQDAHDAHRWDLGRGFDGPMPKLCAWYIWRACAQCTSFLDCLPPLSARPPRDLANPQIPILLPPGSIDLNDLSRLVDAAASLTSAEDSVLQVGGGSLRLPAFSLHALISNWAKRRVNGIGRAAAALEPPARAPVPTRAKR